MELRLADLERRLYAVDTDADVADISSRIDGLMRSALSTSSSKRGALHDDSRAINKLLLELDMSSIAGPTATADEDDAPMVYRRLEVLANAESMRRDMEILARIRDLVAIGTKAGAGEVANCPIVTSSRYDISNDSETIDRLDRLCYRVANLSGRVLNASRRADDMLNLYGKIVMALSEKLVLAEEQLNDNKSKTAAAR